MSDDNTNLYVIKNVTKKNVYCTETWSNPDTDEEFEIEEMFRWGETVLRLTDEEYKEIVQDMTEGVPITVTNYDIEDQNLDDGCAMDFAGDAEIVEKVEAIYDDGQYMALEDAGFYHDDSVVTYYGEVSLEKVE